jgi:serine protease Do
MNLFSRRRGFAGVIRRFLPVIFFAAGTAKLLAASSDILDVRRDATVMAVEQVLPSVVNIATRNIVPPRDPMEEAFRRFFDPFYRQQPPDSTYSLGSGVVIDEAGYLLTNDHVVRQADEIAVKFVAGTNVYSATVVAEDARRDVALLKLNAAPGEKFHAIKLAREDDLLLGETVLALGNPFGLGGTVTRGILSSKSRSMPKENQKLDVWNWLQTDAPINPGNSGGPLVNLRGELIGINVAVVNEVEGLPAQGIGFAIPIKLVEDALSDILPTEYVRSYWFGARARVGSYPLVLTSVQPDSPAGRAGLRVGDAVLQVNGKVPRSFIEFGNLLATNAGSEVSITVRRDTELKDFKVRLVPVATVFNANMVREKLGVSLEALTPALAQHYRVNAIGFVISDVEKGSPADDAGLQKGMLITAVDGQPVTDVTTLAKNIYAKKKGEPVTLNIAALQHAGTFNFWGQASVELIPR